MPEGISIKPCWSAQTIVQFYSWAVKEQAAYDKATYITMASTLMLCIYPPWWLKIVSHWSPKSLMNVFGHDCDQRIWGTSIVLLWLNWCLLFCSFSYRPCYHKLHFADTRQNCYREEKMKKKFTIFRSKSTSMGSFINSSNKTYR